MKTRFDSKKSTSFGGFLLLTGLTIIFTAAVFPLLSSTESDSFALYMGVPLAGIVSGLFIWYWLDTGYVIDQDLLRIRSEPFSWGIRIEEITFIRLNQKTMGGCFKPTLSWRGMEIRHGKYRSVFISPERQREFLKQLTAINSTIEIKNK